VADALIETLAETFVLNPGMSRTLMREHVDDGAGGCAACSTQMTRVTWPCVLVGLTSRANEARALTRATGGSFG
jgi:hypothetical protein